MTDFQGTSPARQITLNRGGEKGGNARRLHEFQFTFRPVNGPNADECERGSSNANAKTLLKGKRQTERQNSRQ